jgi:outer membrane immunogenic protein
MHRTFFLLLLGALTLGGVQAGLAADLPLKTSQAFPETFDWSGIYLGGNIGWGWATNDNDDPAIVQFLLVPATIQTVNSNGFLGGVQVGTNYQFGKLVVGAEGDWDWSHINGNNTTTGIYRLLAPPGFTRIGSDNTDWTATATTRIGIAHDHWLLYGKAGAAWAHTSYTDNWPGTPFGLTGPFFTGTGGSTRTGWTVGSGLEYAFMGNWSAKLEYNYMNFGNTTTTIAGASPFLGPTGSTFGMQNNQQISEVKFGINYKFMPNVW